MAIPNEENHKEIINKNIRLINTLLSISIFVLLCILILKTTSFFDKTFIYTLLFIQTLTLYICNIKWNQKILLYIHYIYCILIYSSLAFNNIYILLYFILVVMMNVYVWHVNDNSCIFGGLDWGNDSLEYWGGYLFRLFPLFYILKIAYIRNKSNSNANAINVIMDDMENLIENKLPEKILDVSFEELHDKLLENIKKIKMIEINEMN